MILEGWGRYPRLASEVLECATPAAAVEALAHISGVIARGNGRSYGDAALGNAATLMCRGLGRMKSFHPETRLLTVEGGTMLSDILDAFIPRGYFPPVVPGTKFVTVGGMIASDVHGKNHHRDGGFGAHVAALKLLLPDGGIVTCSRDENPELFFATIGGMGLTGVITEASFHMNRIETGWIHQTTVVASDLGEALATLQAADTASYSVAWIDCLSRGASLGRSLIFAGEHATPEQVLSHKPQAGIFPPPKKTNIALPLDLPGWVLNHASVSAFNEAYFRLGARKSAAPSLVHWNPYFFPLDGISQWNRLYGKSGFLQHQCVVPGNNALPVLGEVLQRFADSSRGSFLAVLKKLGPGTGLLSFPAPGYTLALDLPVTQDVFPLLDEIDKIVVDAGGRLYLAKDARQSRQTFEAGYPELPKFRNLRRATGADRRFVSRLATRLDL